MGKRSRTGRQGTLHRAPGTETATAPGARLARTVNYVGATAFEALGQRVEAGDWAGALHAADTAQAAVEVGRKRAVALARDSGATWEQIAQAMGLASKQTAHARYGNL